MMYDRLVVAAEIRRQDVFQRAWTKIVEIASQHSPGLQRYVAWYGDIAADWAMWGRERHDETTNNVVEVRAVQPI